MTARSAIPRLAGAAEFAKLAGVSHSSVVVNWRGRFPDFPESLQDLAMGPVYVEAECQAFLDRHPELTAGPRTIPDETREAVRTAIQNGQVNVSKLARDHGVSRSSVYALAGDLLFGDQDSATDDGGTDPGVDSARVAATT